KKAIRCGIKNIVNISSQSVYSQKEKDITDESSEIAPESLYGMAKFASERIVASICEQEGVNYSNIRLASLTGLNFDVRMTNRFVKKAINGEPIVINGGEQLISYLEVRDAADALIRMIEPIPSKWKRVYNLGSNESFPLIEIAKKVKESVNQHVDNDTVIIKKDRLPSFNNLIDSDLFYRDFNWKPNYTISILINELISK